MENQFIELVKRETLNLEKVDYFFSYEELTNKHGFILKEILTCKNISGNDGYITIFSRQNSKAVKVEVEVETQSEGTLTYQSYYVSKDIRELFKNPYN